MRGQRATLVKTKRLALEARLAHAADGRELGATRSDPSGSDPQALARWAAHTAPVLWAKSSAALDAAHRGQRSAAPPPAVGSAKRSRARPPQSVRREQTARGSGEGGVTTWKKEWTPEEWEEWRRSQPRSPRSLASDPL